MPIIPVEYRYDIEIENLDMSKNAISRIICQYVENQNTVYQD